MYMHPSEEWFAPCLEAVYKSPINGAEELCDSAEPDMVV